MVYFIKSETIGLIKIGYCGEKNCEKRLRDLKCSNPDNLILIGVIHFVNIKYEKELHKRFSYLRIKGEWFSPGKELLDFIDKNAKNLINFKESIHPEFEGLWRYRRGILKARHEHKIQKNGKVCIGASREIPTSCK